MGNGASTLSRADGGALVKALQAEMDKYSKMGYGDLIIKEKLAERYEQFMTAQKKADKGKKPATKEAPATAVAKSGGLSAGAGDVQLKAGTGKGGTRRRSFEPSSKPAEVKKMMVSQSEQVLETVKSSTDEGTGESETNNASTEPASAGTDEKQSVEAVPSNKKDHWDSVSEMPYCNACKMAFKTPGLLQRHIKYSDLHAKTIAKLAADPTDKSNPTSVLDDDKLKDDGDAAAVLPVKQKEGEHYKLLYYGSKFFWRTSDNIDFSIFLHIISDVIEVVPFDVTKNKEMPRIYLKHDICVDLFQEEIAQQRRQSVVKSGKFGNKNGAQDEEQGARKALTTGILARLHLHDIIDPQSVTSLDDNTRTPRRNIVYLPGAADDDSKAMPLIEGNPPGLIPVSVAHRRKTSSEEVAAKLHDFKQSQKALSAATDKAEKVIGAVTAFAKNMKREAAAMAKMSVPRKRWVLAINRIMQINGVAKTTKVLEALALKNAQQSPGAKRRARAKAIS